MPLCRCRTLISPHSFMQTTLTRSDYVRPGCDCQSISVSQYLPGVIRVDGVINKGRLQVCMKPPPSGFTVSSPTTHKLTTALLIMAELARSNKKDMRTSNEGLRFVIEV